MSIVYENKEELCVSHEVVHAKTYVVNQLVWLKQHGYPWWPGIVIPAESANLTLPEDKNLCILCFPSNASTIAFGNSNDVHEVCPFHGANDLDMINEGKSVAECAVAIDEALAIYNSSEYTHKDNIAKDNTVQNQLFTNEKKEEEEQEEQNIINESNSNMSNNYINDVNDNDIDNNVKEHNLVKSEERKRTREHEHSKRQRSTEEDALDDNHSERRHRHHHRHQHRHSSGHGHEHRKESEQIHKASESSNKSTLSVKKPEEESEQYEQLEESSELSSERRVRQIENEVEARQSRLDEYEFESQQLPPYMQSKSHYKNNNHNHNNNKNRHKSYHRVKKDKHAIHDSLDNDDSDDTESKQVNGRKRQLKQYEEEEQVEEQVEEEEEEEDDAHYYYRKCREGRTQMSNTSLEAIGAELRRVIAICLNELSFEEHEELLLSLLRPLTTCDVTLPQLQETRIGIIVGQLLMRSFPLRVNQLAHAILTYWFRSLPSSMQDNFVADNEVDRCSIDTTAGSRSSDAHPALGAVGVHIFESFTDEELDDAPPQMDVIELCKEFEVALQDGKDNFDTRVQVLSELGSSGNGELRRALLDGKVTVQEVISHVNNLPHLLHRFHRSRLRRMGSTLSVKTNNLASDDTDGSLSPSSPFSPMMTGTSATDANESSASPTLRGGLGNVTTMYECPNCGAHEAYRTIYTVAAHDNFPDILRCKQCGFTWNMSEQPSETEESVP